MTAKNYNAIAKILNEATTEDSGILKYTKSAGILIHELANYFESENERFDEERFIKAVKS